MIHGCVHCMGYNGRVGQTEANIEAYLTLILANRSLGLIIATNLGPRSKTDIKP